MIGMRLHGEEVEEQGHPARHNPALSAEDCEGERYGRRKIKNELNVLPSCEDQEGGRYGRRG